MAPPPVYKSGLEGKVLPEGSRFDPVQGWTTPTTGTLYIEPSSPQVLLALPFLASGHALGLPLCRCKELFHAYLRRSASMRDQAREGPFTRLNTLTPGPLGWVFWFVLGG